MFVEVFMLAGLKILICRGLECGWFGGDVSVQEKKGGADLLTEPAGRGVHVIST